MPSYEMFADFYDSLTDNVEYEKRADYIVNVLEKNFNHDLGLTLDLACGTGTMTMLLKEKGIDVYGVDGSYDMLTVAQQKTMEKGLNILYLCQRMESLDLYGTIDTCICTLDSLNHIVDEKVFTKAIERVSLFMNKGGYFLFDLNTLISIERFWLTIPLSLKQMKFSWHGKIPCKKMTLWILTLISLLRKKICMKDIAKVLVREPILLNLWKRF